MNKLKKILLISTILFSGFYSNANAQDATPDSYYKKGNEDFLKLNKKSLSEAIVNYTKAIAGDKKNALYYAARAQSRAVLYELNQNLKRDYYTQEKLLNDAFYDAFFAIDMNTNLSESHKAMSIVYYLQKRWDDAHKEAKEAIKLNKSDSDAYLWYWLSGSKVRDWQDSYITTALNLNPNNALALMHQALIMNSYKKSFGNEAIDVMTKVTQLAPENDVAYTFIGYWELIKGTNEKEAIANLEKAISIDDSNGIANILLGSIYYKNGDKTKGLELNKKACLDNVEAGCDFLKKYH